MAYDCAACGGTIEDAECYHRQQSICFEHHDWEEIEVEDADEYVHVDCGQPFRGLDED